LLFLHRSNPEDELFLVAFKERLELLVDFTSSIDRIQDEISKMKPDGGTALFGAPYLKLGANK
jgi:Ca-activated chloride channel family protein